MGDNTANKVFDLFHRISEEDSASIRKLIGELDLYDLVEFRNVGSGTRDISLLKTNTGNEKTPTLIYQGNYVQDLLKIEELLRGFRKNPRQI